MVLASVIIAAFNAADSIERAIASARAQTVGDVEILVIDDGSTDQTSAIVCELARCDSRIRLLPNIGNKGVSAARNRGILEAKGDWLAILDADDAFAPDRIERLTNAAEQAGADIIVDNIAYYDWHARRLTGVIAIAGTTISGRIDLSTFFTNTITGRSPFDFGQLKPVVRGSFLNRHPVLYQESTRHGEDFLFLAHLLLEGAMMILFQAPLYLYTERTGSISHAPSGLTRTIESCRQMREDTLTLLRHPAIRVNEALSVLLRRRVQAIYWHQSWERVYPVVRRRNIQGIVMVALKDWRVTLLLMQKLINRFRVYGDIFK